MNGGWGISYEIALSWMTLDLTDDKSTLVQVMALTATSHYLSQCWPRSMSPNGITRPQWVITHTHIHVCMYIYLYILNMLFPKEFCQINDNIDVNIFHEGYECHLLLISWSRLVAELFSLCKGEFRHSLEPAKKRNIIQEWRSTFFFILNGLWGPMSP